MKENLNLLILELCKRKPSNEFVITLYDPKTFEVTYQVKMQVNNG